MILLDTNVLSALMQREPDAVVIQWLDLQPRISIWTTTITVFEIQCGLRMMPAGKRRNALTTAFGKLLQVMEQRIAPFDTAAAEQAAMLFAARRKRGQPGELRDTMIAGIAHATRATLATRNIRHFADLATHVINPWES